MTIIKLGVAVQMTDEAVLSGYGDPIGEAASQIALAIDDAMDNQLLAKVAALTDVTRVYATTNSTTALVPGDIPKALAKFGEDLEGEKALLVTPEFYAKLVGSDWIPASEIAANVRIKGAVGMAYGCQVIISNRLVTAGDMYIIKPGSLAVFMKRDAMIETDRDILNQSTVLAGSILAAPYLLNPTGVVKLTLGS